MSMDTAKDLNKRLLKFTRGDSSDVNDALEALQALDTATITLPMLKETKLGHTVAKLRKHEDERLNALAKKLVKEWKNMAQSPRPTSKSESTSKKEPETSKVPRRELLSKKPNVPFLPDGLDKSRAIVRTKLKEILSMNEDLEVEEDIREDVALSIEIAMARQYKMGALGELKKDFTAKFRQLSFNLKKNGALREKLLRNLVSAEELITLPAEELATEEKRNEMQKLRDTAFQKARLDWADANEDRINKSLGLENVQGLFTCGRCKSTKTSNTQKQTRSADEPMTVFVRCNNCGNRWKC